MPAEGFVRADDGVRLFFRVQGTGLPVVLCNGLAVGTFFWDPIAARLADRYQVVQWDYRGHGNSERRLTPRTITLERCADDLAAVLDGLDVPRAVVAGHSMGTQVAFEAFRKHRHRVAALIPTLGPYRRAMDSFFDSVASAPIFSVLQPLVARYPDLVAALVRPLLPTALSDSIARRTGMVHESLMSNAWLGRYLHHAATLDLAGFASLAGEMQRADATDILRGIDVPTLIVAGDRDRFCPPRVAREMHALIPTADLFMLEDGTHAAVVEQPDAIAARIRAFLEESVCRR